MNGDRDRRVLESVATQRREVVEVGSESQRRQDQLAREEPLEIRVSAEAGGVRESHSVAITMRTPGEDFELAAGFLYSEGVIRQRGDLWQIGRCPDAGAEESENIVEVHLAPDVAFDAEALSRHVYMTSSCGVCGKASLAAVRASMPSAPEARGGARLKVTAEQVVKLTATMSAAQDLFSRTGGLHAAGLFDPAGSLQLLREDVGRHNAVDKVIGAVFLDDGLPLAETLLLVSGRASFELVQKAAMAGVPILLAVGAPSSLAVETADSLKMTLIGFLRDGRFNIYCGEERIDTSG